MAFRKHERQNHQIVWRSELSNHKTQHGADLQRLSRWCEGSSDKFPNFFRISSYFHCRVGLGTWAIGQGCEVMAIGVSFISKNKPLAATVIWLEKGATPNGTERTRFMNHIMVHRVAFQRCHYNSVGLFFFENQFTWADIMEDIRWRTLMRKEFIIYQMTAYVSILGTRSQVFKLDNRLSIHLWLWVIKVLYRAFGFTD